MSIFANNLAGCFLLARLIPVPDLGLNVRETRTGMVPSDPRAISFRKCARRPPVETVRTP
jgi:hypothetical protein